jgi:hypothetical protein
VLVNKEGHNVGCELLISASSIRVALTVAPRPQESQGALDGRTVPRSCDPAGTERHLGGSYLFPSFISTVRVRNSSLPTFSRECGVSGAPQEAVPKTGVDFDALVSASTFPSGSRRTKSLVVRM